jgi:hypothetical protein
MKPPSTKPLDLALLNADERLSEIGALLALGLVRLHARKSSGFSALSGESSLACVGGQSGHANPAFEGEADHA